MILTAARRALGAVSTIRPYASAVVEPERDAESGGALALGEGDPALTERLGERLGLIWSRVARPPDELVVVVVGRRSDVPRVAQELAARKAAGGRMLAVLVGTRAEVLPGQVGDVVGHGQRRVHAFPVVDVHEAHVGLLRLQGCLLYTSPSPRDS